MGIKSSKAVKELDARSRNAQTRRSQSNALACFAGIQQAILIRHYSAVVHLNCPRKLSSHSSLTYNDIDVSILIYKRDYRCRVVMKVDEYGRFIVESC